MPDILQDYPALAGVVKTLNAFLETNHPTVFGPEAVHPFLPSKRSKVIHDNLWGTVRFSWRELALIDSPVMQRLRDVHQTGLAYQVYPSSRHSRFEHSLGAATISGRVYDALLHKHRGEIHDIAVAVAPKTKPEESILRFRQELKLAALLHDTGHSLFSHTSEKVYEGLEPLAQASRELSKFVGKEKGAGEVLSFCLVLTPAISRLLERAEKRLVGDIASDDYEGQIDLRNVALIIVGRSPHPFLQFLGDIVSSGFDADKLDYLLRDAKAAGLPLRYDIDRYLYDVRIDKTLLADGEGKLEALYGKLSDVNIERRPKGKGAAYDSYDTYKLRLSRRAMNVVEQIVICKMMLFSYIYHHAKVRAAEGVLERLLRRMLARWRSQGVNDNVNLDTFFGMTDAALSNISKNDEDPIVKEYAYRVENRFLPREVYSISGPSATHAARVIIRDFLLLLHDRTERQRAIADLETAIGEELIKIKPELGTDVDRALAVAGVWVDAPKPPKFEDVDAVMVSSKNTISGVAMAQAFPIREWTEAYEHYRYQVRIFAFSEYWELTRRAGKTAMQRILKISGDSFYEAIGRDRD